MPKSKFRKTKTPKRVLALPDLEHAKTATVALVASCVPALKAAHVDPALALRCE